MKDVGINQDQFNIGQQMLSLGIVLFEIPSNMILYRVGPGKWLTLQLFLFGLVSLFQAFQKGYGVFIATRLLLGMTESGFIPGGLYTLSTWCTFYGPRCEGTQLTRIVFQILGRRLRKGELVQVLPRARDFTELRQTGSCSSISYAFSHRVEKSETELLSQGNQFGQASSKLLAYGILHMRGVGGKPGWFWLFALMGIFTIAGGFVFVRDPPFSFPPSQLTPVRAGLLPPRLVQEPSIYVPSQEDLVHPAGTPYPQDSRAARRSHEGREEEAHRSHRLQAGCEFLAFVVPPSQS